MYRSYLFSPASDAAKMEKALGSDADAVIFDLEDGVAPQEKEPARRQLASFLAAIDWDRPLPAVFVRVNGAATPWFHADLQHVFHPRVAGYAVPKAEAREALEVAEALLTAAAGSPDAPFEILPFVESAQAVWHLPQIAGGMPRVRRVAFGGVDLATELGFDPDPGAPGYLVARGLLALLSRVARLEPPVDTVYPPFRDTEGLAGEARLVRQLGFFGKLAIHPGQVAVINAAFTPVEAELRWARSVLETYHRATASGQGVADLAGTMVERPVAERARRIVELAERVRERGGRNP